MWHPTSVVTRACREHVPLAPQLVHQDWLTACRSSAPHSSVDTGTPYRRSVVPSSVPAGQTVSCTLVCCYFKGVTAILVYAGRHSTSAVAVAVLMRPPRCAVHCPVLLMAACRQCCIAVPVGTTQFSADPLVALLDCPPFRCSFSHGCPARPDCPISWCSSFPVVLHGGLSYSSCPGRRRRFALGDCLGAVAPGWLLSRITQMPLLVACWGASIHTALAKFSRVSFWGALLLVTGSAFTLLTIAPPI